MKIALLIQANIKLSAQTIDSGKPTCNLLADLLTAEFAEKNPQRTAEKIIVISAILLANFSPNH